MTQIPAWVAPSARDLTRDYMVAQLAARGDDAPWSSSIPSQRPGRFYTIEELNSTTEYGVFADAQMLQIRGYDTDLKVLGARMRLIKGLWKVMPAEFTVQDVEHAGGPSYDEDPDIPGLRYGQLIAWVTVMTTLEIDFPSNSGGADSAHRKEAEKLMTAPTYVGNVNNVILPSPKDLPIVGGLFWGPLDAAIPGATMAIDDAMAHLGFVAEDGIDESEDRPTTKIFAWGGDIVAAPQDSYSLTEVFTLYEFLNPEVAKAAYGEDNVTVTVATASAGTKMSILVTSDVFEHHTWLLDTYGVGGKRVQKFVPYGQVTNKDTQTMNHKTVLAHRLTVECFPDTAGKYAYIRTDDGVFSV